MHKSKSKSHALSIFSLLFICARCDDPTGNMYEERDVLLDARDTEEWEMATSAQKTTAPRANEVLAKALSEALTNDSLRRDVYEALAKSSQSEKKLHFRTFLGTPAGARVGHALARSLPSSMSFEVWIASAPDLEFYMPVHAHRQSWRGTEPILVATLIDDTEEVVVFEQGQRRDYDRGVVPTDPTLALVPAESFREDGTLIEKELSLTDEPLGAGQKYLTASGVSVGQLYEYKYQNEPWAKGDPDFELQLYNAKTKKRVSCSDAVISAYPFRWDMNSKEWNGKVAIGMEGVHLLQGETYVLALVENDGGEACDFRSPTDLIGTTVSAVQGVAKLAGIKLNNGSLWITNTLTHYEYSNYQGDDPDDLVGVTTPLKFDSSITPFLNKDKANAGSIRLKWGAEDF